VYCSDWNPMMDAQAQDRAHRIGQKNEVKVFRLLTNSPIEERILARANDKKNLTGLVVEAGKFNAKTQNNPSENKEMMESLLNEWSMGGAAVMDDSSLMKGENGEEQEGEWDALDDDQINQMLASNEGEMELYQKMDADMLSEQRAKLFLKTQPGGTSSKGKSNVPIVPAVRSRLMASSEIPKWLTTECWPSKYMTIMRDMMNMSSENNALDGDWNAEDEVADGDNSAKKGRKRKDVIYDDGMTELQFQRFVEKQQDFEEHGKMELPKAFVNKLEASSGDVFSAILVAVKTAQKAKSESGQAYSLLFTEKPNKSIYPDYYQVISEPISLKEISAKIKKKEYRFFEEIEMDFAKMSNNARLFNGDTSPVFYDAEFLRGEFYGACTLLREFYGMPLKTHPPELPKMGFRIFESQQSYKEFLLSEHMAMPMPASYGQANKQSKRKKPGPKPKKAKIEAQINDDAEQEEEDMELDDNHSSDKLILSFPKRFGKGKDGINQV
jgi:ATP-dependent helicase STH1/SNF2